MRLRPWLLGVAVLVVVVVVAVVLATRPDTTLDPTASGGERRPDVAGVITEVDESGVTLDGGGRYRFGPESAAFSAYTQDPVGARPNLFVHLRVDGDLVVWMSVLGVVADVDPPRVSYTGTIEPTSDGELVFSDGTVLPVADGVTWLPGFAIATIDPLTGRVVEVVQDVVDP